MSSGRSKLGPSPVAADAKTAFGDLLSGRSHDPPYAAIAQGTEWAVKRPVILQRSVSWVPCRAAIEMFRHGISIAEFVAPESTASPVSPMRMGEIGRGAPMCFGNSFPR
jgi:hypothetical protein